MKISKILLWAVPTLSVSAFIALLVGFGLELDAFRNSVVMWAYRDLDARTHLAAIGLSEILRTQDFSSLHLLGDEFAERGYNLAIVTGRGGIVYDRRFLQDNTVRITSRAAVDNYSVILSRSMERTMEPFHRAKLALTLSALVGAAGMSLLLVAFFRQHIRLRAQRERIDAMARLERFRCEFIADFSHELKTPLTGIIGAAEMLDEADSSALPALKTMISREARRLDMLAKQILELSRLDNEESAAGVRVPFSLSMLCEELAIRYKVRYKCDFPDNIELNGDAEIIGRAIENLLVNAIRHSGTDDITLELRFDSSLLHIAVEDHGIGVPADERERIFERFHRLDRSRSAVGGVAAGSGLGLAIVRSIARSYKGDCRCLPAVPHGSRFEITLLLP